MSECVRACVRASAWAKYAQYRSLSEGSGRGRDREGRGREGGGGQTHRQIHTDMPVRVWISVCMYVCARCSKFVREVSLSKATLPTLLAIFD